MKGLDGKALSVLRISRGALFSMLDNQELRIFRHPLLISGTSLAESPSREAVLKAVMLAKKNHTRLIFDIDYREYNWKNKDEHMCRFHFPPPVS